MRPITGRTGRPARMPMNLNSGPANEPKPEGEKIVSGRTTLSGEVSIPKGAGAVVLFAHGSGSSRHSPFRSAHRSGGSAGHEDAASAFRHRLARGTPG